MTRPHDTDIQFCDWSAPRSMRASGFSIVCLPGGKVVLVDEATDTDVATFYGARAILRAWQFARAYRALARRHAARG